MGVISNLHAQLTPKDIENAALYYQVACFKAYGSRHRMRPGWNRPGLVDVEHWGGEWCLMKDIFTGKKHVFPAWQLEGFEKNTVAGSSTFNRCTPNVGRR